MKYVAMFFSLALSAMPVKAVQQEALDDAESWLQQLSTSLNTLNFSTSFVVVKNNHAEPYHWFHGVNDQGEKLEILSLLNGPRRDVLRKGNVISYIEPELSPYSVTSTRLTGPIPNIFSGDIGKLTEHYNFIPGGKSRVLGRSAQIVRIIPKDANKYAYWLWLDQKNSLLLKLAIVTRKGPTTRANSVYSHLEISEHLAESLKQLAQTDLPDIVEIPDGYQQQQLSWQVDWLPQGFKQVNANRHRIVTTQQPVEFQSFSDGLVNISVYVTPSQEAQRGPDFVMDGATIAFTQISQGFEISVVGKIPSTTAKRIADSISAVVSHSTP